MDTVVRTGQIAAGGAGMSLEWAMATQRRPLGERSGDGYLIRQTGNTVVLAVVDGTGSGAAAAHAAEICLVTIAESRSCQLAPQFEACHQALQGSRGAALGLATVDLLGCRIAWASIGDVDGLLLQPGSDGSVRRRAIFQRGGTLGLHYPGIRPQQHDLDPGNLVLLTTDGISRRYRQAVRFGQPAGQAATNTLADFGVDTDDRLVLALSVEAA